MKPEGQAPAVPAASVEVLMETCPAAVPITAAAPLLFKSLEITLGEEVPGETDVNVSSIASIQLFTVTVITLDVAVQPPTLVRIAL